MRELRLERGWTQQQLADRMNYERSRIHRLEQGQTAISVDILLVIANALEVGLPSLLPVEVRLKTDVSREQVLTCPSANLLITTASPSSPSALP